MHPVPKAHPPTIKIPKTTQDQRPPKRFEAVLIGSIFACERNLVRISSVRKQFFGFFSPRILQIFGA